VAADCRARDGGHHRDETEVPRVIGRSIDECLVAGIIALGLLVAGGCRSDATREIVLQNGGFEPLSDVEKSPSGWYATELPQTKDYVAFTWDDSVKHSGRRSVSIAIDADHPDEPIAYNWTRTLHGWQVGGAYELTGWIKTRDLAEPAWICVQCWNSDRSEMLGFTTTQHDYPIAGTTDWTRAGLAFEVPPGTAEVRVRAGIATPADRGGQAWFDDLEVREVG
jgi:hypothetical protein